MKKTERTNKYTSHETVDRGIFAVLFLGVMAVMLVLFHRQCVESLTDSGLYHSDMKAYILEMQGLDSGYPFPYPVLFRTAAFISLFAAPEWAMAIATTLFCGIALLLTKWSLNRLAYPALSRSFPDRGWLAGVCISVVAVGLFFVSMVYPPAGIYLPGIRYTYLGVFTANPFHNATYMAARPFAILAFLWYVKLLDIYEDDGKRGKNVTDYLLFSVFLLLATMTKPSFTLVLVGTAGLIMGCRLIRSRCRNLKGTFLLGLAFLPTFADLLYQFQGVFMPGEGVEGGIGFCMGDIWRLYCDNIPLAIGLAVGFPIVVLLCNYRELLQNTLYRFSWQIYLMGFAMAFLLYEKGFRAPDFNFSWGYMYGIFFVFFGSAGVLLRATAKREKPFLLTLQWLAFLWHLICGLYYFLGIFQGRMYY